MRHIIGLVYLVLYLCQYISCNYFYHTHYFSWGKVTHSHPYVPVDGTPGHTHTPAQCSFINAITTQDFPGIETATVPAVLSILLLTLCAENGTGKSESFLFSIRGRSPPVC